MEKTQEIIRNNNQGLKSAGIEQNNTSLSSNECLSDIGSSNKANLSSDSPLTENLTSGSSILRSQSFHSIAHSTAELMDPRSRSCVDLHCMGDGFVDFSIQHGSDSEGKVSPGNRSGSTGKGSLERGSGLYGELSPERGSGLYGGGSPEHGSSSYGILSPEDTSGLCGSGSDGTPKPAMDENKIENSPPYNVDLGEELDREITKEEEKEEEDDNIKRIKDWINQIDISSDMIVEEMGESSESWSGAGPVSDKVGPIHAPRGGPADPKASVGMAMAYNYISAMNPVTASAQLSNLGLVAVPILSAFAGLKELNLSGNNILQITAGALPKGLHVLNLSKNYISVIEGLKDLCKLRMLDLSHNRISRIGHGLAACCSLRELYLAANKISEVEGLHRLLKLKILDLRTNKLSTAKGLEQLAANYTSLEAISLDGNPAQRNVGDDHLKKYLLTLLPNLVYYNRHSVKSRGKKDAITMPSLKPSHRSAGLGGSGMKSRTSSRSGTSSLLKASRSRNVQLPLSSSRFAGRDAGKQVLGMNPLRRIQSEGAMEG